MEFKNKEERLVPVSWIEKVEAGTIRLAVESSVLNRLQPYLADRLAESAEARS